MNNAIGDKSDKQGSNSAKEFEFLIEFKFIDLLYILFRYKKRIITICSIVGILTAIYAWFIMPIVFEANAVILLSQQKSGGLSGLMPDIDLPIDVGGIGKSSVEGNKMLMILNSRRLLHSVIDHFDLKTLFKQKYYSETVKLLKQNLIYEFNKDNQTISITVYYAEDTLKCLEITDYIVNKLDEINKELTIERATAYRKFIEKRYIQNQEDIKSAEDSLLRFQKKHGLFSIDDQTKATISTIAELESQYIAAEIEFNFLKAGLSKDHPEVIRASQKMKEIYKQKDLIQSTGGGSNIILPLKKGPELALEYYRLRKNLEIQTKIQVFLLPQYEQAKLQEAKDTPTLQVLDRAIKPEKRSKPKRTILTLTVIIITFSFVYSYYLLRDRILTNIRKQKKSHQYEFVENEFRNILRFFKLKR